MSSTSRIQVTVDAELAAAVDEFGEGSRSKTVRDLAVRGAAALREEQHRRHDAIEFLQRIATGEDDRFDFAITTQLHAERH